MKISELLSDEAILTELGERVARSRIDLQLTQAEAAAQAGISKRTLERIESGASAQSSSLIRILRVLDLLPRLERMFPETGPGPMELLRHKGKARQRASTRGHSERPEGAWTWDDDQ
ncbi:MAG: helix-turn-helix domain-containing protein [Gammaproteobacteria bacterium]|nr:helix-turn-helix domain-containing protein [Gammaproteobacteria bacterium]